MQRMWEGSDANRIHRSCACLFGWKICPVPRRDVSGHKHDGRLDQYARLSNGATFGNEPVPAIPSSSAVACNLQMNLCLPKPIRQIFLTRTSIKSHPRALKYISNTSETAFSKQAFAGSAVALHPFLQMTVPVLMLSRQKERNMLYEGGYKSCRPEKDVVFF